MEATIQPKGSEGWELALFGATSLLGQALRDCLDRRSFPVRSIRLFDRPEKEGSITEFRNEAVLVTRPDPDLLQRVDLAFLCGGPEESSGFLGWPEEKQFVAIDLSTASNRDPAVPVIHYGLNRSRIDLARRVIATPGPVAHALSTLLAPIDREGGIESAIATVFPPASDRGEEGLNELYRQTVNLLNFQDIPREVFTRQLAFNLIPRPLYEPRRGAGPTPEEAMAAETLRVLEADFPLEIGIVLAPVFHCHSILLRIECRRPAPPAEIAAWLGERDDLCILGDGEEKTTPVELAGEEAIHVRPLPAPGRGNSVWIWVVSDSLRTGAALNAVRLAEYLVGQGEEKG